MIFSKYPLIREVLEQRESSFLAPFACLNRFSKGRNFPELKDPWRLDFQRDRDRVLHCKAFRRLKDKTQVVPIKSGDHFRNRLTHSLEVAQISRDLSRNLALNEDLSETIALAHDLGHTPFGHSGEEALNKFMQAFGENFEHNAQSKRVVEFLENPYTSFVGLNLTVETLEGLKKHQTPYDNPGEKFTQATLEAQIVDISDEIAYTAHDTEDGLRSGLIDLQKLQKENFFKLMEESAKTSFKEISGEQIKAELIKFLSEDLMTNSLKNLEAAKIDSYEKVLNAKEKLIKLSPEIRSELNVFRSFLFQNFYMSPQVQNSMEQGKKLLTELLEVYMDEFEKYFPQHKAAEPKQKLTIVKDYVSGMTDSYAQKIHAEIFATR
jgi:dGTPase